MREGGKQRRGVGVITTSSTYLACLDLECAHQCNRRSYDEGVGAAAGVYLKALLLAAGQKGVWYLHT